MAGKRDWNDQRSEQVIGNLLRSGVILSAAVVSLGGVRYVWKYGTAARDFAVFRGEPNDLRHISGILQESLTLHSRGLIQLGLLLLIATPVARVVFSVASFAMERDRLYVCITLIVFILLLYSLMGGNL
ncbi:MAG: DUF1634 domain-containing protein [Candidatus Acidiferrales bacterium]